MRESDYRGQWKEIQVKVKGGDKGTEQITYGWLYLHKVPKMGKLTEKKKVGQRLLGAGSAVDRGGGVGVRGAQGFLLGGERVLEEGGGGGRTALGLPTAVESHAIQGLNTRFSVMYVLPQ